MLVVLSVYNYNVWSLVLDYVVSLDIHVPQRFDVYYYFLLLRCKEPKD